MLSSYVKRFLITLVLLSGITLTAFADDAPVYDADNYPPPFDNEPTVSALPAAIKPGVPSYVPAQTLTQEQRLMRLEQQVKNWSHSDSASKIEAMQAEIQSLRGQVEELSHQLQQAQNQQRAMYTDLDKRLSQSVIQKNASQVQNDLEAKKSITTATSTEKKVPLAEMASTKKTPLPAAPEKITTKNVQPDTAEEQQIYQTAYDLIKAKKYTEAVNTLQKMLQKYPSGQFAANAHYWLGELYGLLNKNDQSAAEFTAVIKNYPDSPKVPDAQLKLGLIYAGEFKWSDAKTAFKTVVSRYPGTASARLASEQLKQLKQSQAQAKAQSGH